MLQRFRLNDGAVDAGAFATMQLAPQDAALLLGATGVCLRGHQVAARAAEGAAVSRWSAHAAGLRWKLDIRASGPTHAKPCRLELSGVVRHDDWSGIDVWLPPADEDDGSRGGSAAEKGLVAHRRAEVPDPLDEWTGAEGGVPDFPLRLSKRELPALVLDDPGSIFELDAVLACVCSDFMALNSC